ncbi:MAG: hypothetical protein GY771_03290 [bacterium]|nr:hypothetical protein [bacterium]
MPQALKKVIIAIFFVLVFSSCDWDLTDNTEEVRGVSGYPVSDGAEWVYSIGSSDEIKYNIEGMYSHPETGDTYVLKEYVRNGLSWSEESTYYVEANEKAVRLYFDDESDRSYRLLVFPIYLRATWGFFNRVTATVTAREVIEVPAGEFTVYKIEYTGDIEFTLWYSPDVGGWGVKNHGWWLYGGDPATIELSSYEIP